MKLTRTTWLCLALVGVLYGVHVHLKTAKIFANRTWDARNDVGQFWSEFAFHYRFAEFFAEHPVRDWGQLAHDRSVQYPDEIDDWAEFTVAMEVPAGVIYRLAGRLALPRPPFHVFVVWYDCLVSSLALFGVFFLGRALWRSNGAGVLAAALYASLYPSYGRTVKNLFLREDFALPLILFALGATAHMLFPRPPAARSDAARGGDDVHREGQHSIGWEVLAGLLWLAALASWQLTQFVLAGAVGATVRVYLGKGVTPRRPWFVLVMTAGAVLVPVLRAKQMYWSPTMCALYALTSAVWIDGGRRKAILVFSGWLVVFLGLSAVFQKSYSEYGHVYQLFFCKLRFLGMKPADPGRLPWEARCLWEGAFNTAGWGEFRHSLQWCGPLAILAILGSSRRADTPVRIFALFALFLFPLAWMVVRFFTFLGPAAAVLVAGLAVQRWWWKPVVLAAAVWQLATLNFRPLDRAPVVPADYRPVVRWVAENTPARAVVLASIAESPVFLAHTGRPIILHSKFENRVIRDRYRELLDSIYGSEDRFYRFCRRYGADYFVFDTGFLLRAPDSRRYKADQMGDLNPNCAAMLFAAAPQRLAHFEPEYVEGRFAVFKVLK